jgi:hypothetical protein
MSNYTNKIYNLFWILLTSIGQLSALQNLYLDDCLNLQELPTSIGQLNAF